MKLQSTLPSRPYATQGPINQPAVVRDSLPIHDHRIERACVGQDDILRPVSREEMPRPVGKRIVVGWDTGLGRDLNLLGKLLGKAKYHLAPSSRENCSANIVIVPIYWPGNKVLATECVDVELPMVACLRFFSTMRPEGRDILGRNPFKVGSSPESVGRLRAYW